MDMYNNIQYYSGIEKKEILPFVTTWMNLKGNMLNKLRQRKTNAMSSHLYVESEKKKNELIEAKFNSDLQGLGSEGNREILV